MNRTSTAVAVALLSSCAPFAAPVSQATRGSALAAVPVDLDGDTRLDLVAACNGGALVVLPGACLP
jgi:hypothetical protein